MLAAALPGARVAVFDTDHHAARLVARRAGGVAVDHVDDLAAADVIALCHPHPHAELAAELLDAGRRVLSLSGEVDDVSNMLALHRRAESMGSTLVVGAAMSPGLSGLIARHLAGQLHVVEEIHVSIHGTGGPECARQHHRSLGDRSPGWHDGEWIERPGGSGRELCWFPEPIGAYDCYRAAMADPLLLQRSFPTVTRISARVSATRRDRLTARLPMLTPPHVGGNIGAVRVELRGADERGGRCTVIGGVAGRTAELAAAVAASVIAAFLDAEVPAGVHTPGSPALCGLGLLVRAAARGVRLQEFTGVARPATF